MVPAALVAYALLTWLRPYIALGVLLFLIPFGHLVRFAVAGVPLTFVEFATYLLAVALLVRQSLALPLKLPLRGGGEKRKWFRDPWVVFPFLWVLVGAIAAIGSPAGMRAWGIWKAYVLGPVLLFWIIRHVFQRTPVPSSVGSGISNDEFLISKQFTNTNNQNLLPLTSYLLLPIAASAFVVAAIAIAQRWWPIGIPYPWSLPGKFRATSVFGYPNAVGLYLAPLVPIFLCMAFRDVGAALRGRPGGDVAPPLRFLCGIAVLASVLAIALARSTGALVALAVAIPAYVIFVRWSWPCRRPRVAASVVVGVWLVLCLTLTVWLPNQREQPRWGPPIVQKLTFQQWSGSVRLAQYRETWALLRDHPIRGAGLAGYQTVIAPYHEKQDVEIFLYPHNLLLAVWVELGLAGLLVFLAIVYQFFRIALRLYGSTALRLASVASMLVILIHGLVDVPHFKNDLAMLFWVMVAFAVVSAVDRQPTPRVR